MSRANEGSGDEILRDDDWMTLIDDILYGEHEQPFSTGDALLMLMYRFASAKGAFTEDEATQ